MCFYLKMYPYRIKSTKKVSIALGKKCDIENINYNTESIRPPYFFATKAMEKTAKSAPEPKKRRKGYNS